MLFLLNFVPLWRSSAEQPTNSGAQEVEESFARKPTQSCIDQTPAVTEMAAASKEAPRDEPVEVKKACQSNGSDSVFTLLYSVVKKVTIVGAIYLVGYMNWSVAWLITPVILAVTREYWRHTSEISREIAKASATANEKDVILARINDLPSWVIEKLFT